MIPAIRSKPSFCRLWSRRAPAGSSFKMTWAPDKRPSSLAIPGRIPAGRLVSELNAESGSSLGEKTDGDRPAVRQEVSFFFGKQRLRQQGALFVIGGISCIFKFRRIGVNVH